ncbi:M10 family metallopeptidase C-terminal domain-containing protein [Sphingomicrobium flavum]|uniref:M10 family metallopeptidase C-terminal domain-containing protein n=1 Tax=Sphingomicrobium flavum TaxID=1229164 RepID=UPI00289F41BE|nr:M10 family metallopeptidase C-terminal domain-containing protein [Sphingomicrobium flavum]
MAPPIKRYYEDDHEHDGLFARGTFEDRDRDTYINDVSDEDPLELNLDPFGGQGFIWRGKPIFDQDGVIKQIDSGREINASNGVITFGFADGNGLTGLYNNPKYGFDAGLGFREFSDSQKAATRESMQMWDDLIAVEIRETNGNGADIIFANSADPGQAYAYLPIPTRGWKFQSDVFVREPAENWTNEWFGTGGYGKTTILHEAGHSLGLTHPGDYNGAGATNYLGQAEYAQDSEQYTLMSYWSASETGARIVDWNTFLFHNPQTPLLHDILTIQAKYGADPDTRADDTTYGFNTNTTLWVYDFNLNPYPYLSVYDSGGIDTIDASGFTVSQFIDLHQGSFSSIGAGAPNAADVNAARAEISELAGGGFGPISQGTINAVIANYQTGHANSIASDTAFVYGEAVTGITTTEYQNFSIAYGTIIENATGGSGRDLIFGNEVDNVLKGMAGNDVIDGFEGDDIIIGGLGADKLTGGEGADTFVFDNLELGDLITDFESEDMIDLSALGENAISELSFIGDAEFSGGSDNAEVRYKDGMLQADVDGDGVADFQVYLEGMPDVMPDQLILLDG